MLVYHSALQCVYEFSSACRSRFLATNFVRSSAIAGRKCIPNLLPQVKATETFGEVHLCLKACNSNWRVSRENRSDTLNDIPLTSLTIYFK
mmetsp:Transcript_10423/g.14383  ORF Transcript_10423/g.14383 Transcript_10423/m.14383 type:complete len:91 (+) Transcript_10423:45-317(+)